MTTRKQLVSGSLAGAAAIHLAMLACSGADTSLLDDRDAGRRDAAGDVTIASDATSGTDGGFLDTLVDVVRDVLGKVGDAETRDAHAGGDGGTPSCACPPPPVARRSFAFTFERGMGVERPDGPFSTTESEFRVERDSTGETTRELTVRGNFYRTGVRGYLVCRVRVGPSFSLASTRSCTFNLGSEFSSGPSVASIEGGRLAVFEQERIELRYDRLRLCTTLSTPTCVNVGEVVFRIYTPGTTYRDIPNEYQPDP